MRSLRLAIIALLLIPAAASAQNTTAPAAVTPRSTAGDFALLFDLGGLADLAINGFNATDTSLVGAGFGAKYFVANDLALRIGLSIESNSASRPVDSVNNDEFSSFRFAIAPGIVYNVAKNGPIAGYVGAQISYAMSSSTSNPADQSVPDVEATGSALGVGAFIGAEWFPWSQVSLSAEYGLGYTMSTAEEERTPQGGSSTRFELPTENSFGLRSRGVFTLAFYW